MSLEQWVATDGLGIMTEPRARGLYYSVAVPSATHCIYTYIYTYIRILKGDKTRKQHKIFLMEQSGPYPF